MWNSSFNMGTKTFTDRMSDPYQFYRQSLFVPDP